jgi:hypothetical protein
MTSIHPLKRPVEPCPERRPNALWACAIALLQRAFQQGGPVASVAPMTAVTNLQPIAAGIAVFADPFPPTPSLVGARVLAFAAVAGGATLLAPSRLEAPERQRELAAA